MSKGLDTNTDQSRYLTGINFLESNFRFPQQSDKSVAIDDLAVALKNSLANPIDYPPINDALFAGDQIAIALQANLPNPGLIAAAIVNQLSGMDFVIVCSPETAAHLEGMGEVNGKLIIHDPTDENSLAMMGIDDQSAPVYINRLLFDADVVIPIGVAAGPNETMDDCIYPYFSGVADRENFENRSPKSREGQIRLANNQLGAFWGIQLIYGPGDQIHDILAGELLATIHSAKQKMAQVWQVDIEADAELVVATIESEKTNQSWGDFSAAIISADQVAKSGAPIVICSEIAKTPDKKTKAALTQQFESRTAKNLNVTLKKVAAIVSERTVFLQSGLSQVKTEELGLGCVTSPDEIQRIVDRHPSGVLLRDAHRCNLTIG